MSLTCVGCSSFCELPLLIDVLVLGEAFASYTETTRMLASKSFILAKYSRNGAIPWFEDNEAIQY